VKRRTKSIFGRACTGATEWLLRAKPRNRLPHRLTAGTAGVETSQVIVGTVKLKEYAGSHRGTCTACLHPLPPGRRRTPLCPPLGPSAQVGAQRRVEVSPAFVLFFVVMLWMPRGTRMRGQPCHGLFALNQRSCTLQGGARCPQGPSRMPHLSGNLQL